LVKTSRSDGDFVVDDSFCVLGAYVRNIPFTKVSISFMIMPRLLRFMMGVCKARKFVLPSGPEDTRGFGTSFIRFKTDMAIGIKYTVQAFMSSKKTAKRRV